MVITRARARAPTPGGARIGGMDPDHREEGEATQASAPGQARSRKFIKMTTDDKEIALRAEIDKHSSNCQTAKALNTVLMAMGLSPSMNYPAGGRPCTDGY